MEQLQSIGASMTKAWKLHVNNDDDDDTAATADNSFERMNDTSVWNSNESISNDDQSSEQ